MKTIRVMSEMEEAINKCLMDIETLPPNEAYHYKGFKEALIVMSEQCRDMRKIATIIAEEIKGEVERG